MESNHRSQVAQARLSAFINDGQSRAKSVVARIFDEVPEDRVVRGRAMVFGNTAGALRMHFHNGGLELGMHSNALQQAAQKFGLPYSWASEIMGKGDWGTDLVAMNLNELLLHNIEEDARFLVRSVKGEARGLLSDRFRRIDSRPIVDVLVEETKRGGLIAADGLANDTRVSMRFIRPQMLEPVPGEYMVFGFSWTNSDFGRGANELRSFMMRLVCINGAIAAREMRSVHLGGRLDDDMAYSQRTYELDQRATISAVRDVTRQLAAPRRVDDLMAQIREASTKEVEVDKVLASLTRKRAMTQETAKSVAEVFNRPDVEMLPPGNTAWRLSNALSFIARDEADLDKRLDLEKMAGELVIVR